MTRLFTTFSPSIVLGHATSNDSHDLLAMPDSQCLLSELKPSVLDSRPNATTQPPVFGLSSDYFLNLHARIFASLAYNFVGPRLVLPTSLRLPVWRT